MSHTFSVDGIAGNIISIPGHYELDIDNDISCDSKIGEGGTSVIYKGTLSSATLMAKYPFNDVVLKVLKPFNQDLRSLWKLEIAIMSNTPPHPNVVQFVGYSEKPFSIIIKYYPASLSSLLSKPHLLYNHEIMTKVAYDIAVGMMHVHDNGILHLDLKPRKQIIYVYSMVLKNN